MVCPYYHKGNHEKRPLEVISKQQYIYLTPTRLGIRRFARYVKSTYNSGFRSAPSVRTHDPNTQ